MSKPRTFTNANLKWFPWIETIAEVGLPDRELQAIYALAPNARGSPYFSVLAHDLPALVMRTGLFDNTMRSPGGASIADRENAATVTSLLNGCRYCASVHGRRYVQYARKPEIAERLLAGESVTGDRPDSVTEAAILAVLGLSAAFYYFPSPGLKKMISELRSLGYSDLQIYDIGQSAAMFAWANRLMQTLGEPAESGPGF